MKDMSLKEIKLTTFTRQYPKSIYTSCYLYSSVEKFMVLCEILHTNESIRVTQLTAESLFIFVRSKVIPQTTILFHSMQLARNLRVYFHFPNDASSIESSSSYFFSKLNGLEVWRKYPCYCVCRSKYHGS